jgi:hypothetical protein
MARKYSVLTSAIPKGKERPVRKDARVTLCAAELLAQRRAVVWRVRWSVLLGDFAISANPSTAAFRPFHSVESDVKNHVL